MMEELKFIAMTCFVFVALFFLIGMVEDLIKQIKLAKLKKEWAAEQERAKISHDIKLGYCKKCPSKANRINYFGQPCIFNSEWLCEGPAAPEEPIIKIEASEDWVKVTRCKDCQFWKNQQYCSKMKFGVTNPDWFCATGSPQEDK